MSQTDCETKGILCEPFITRLTTTGTTNGRRRPARPSSLESNFPRLEGKQDSSEEARMLSAEPETRLESLLEILPNKMRCSGRAEYDASAKKRHKCEAHTSLFDSLSPSSEARSFALSPPRELANNMPIKTARQSSGSCQFR